MVKKSSRKRISKICAYEKCGKEFVPKTRNDQKYHSHNCKQAAYDAKNFVRIADIIPKQIEEAHKFIERTIPEMKRPRNKKPSDFLKRPGLKPAQVGTIIHWAQVHPESPNAADIERIMSRLMTPIYPRGEERS